MEKREYSEARSLLAAAWADKFLTVGAHRGLEASTAPNRCVALGTLLPSFSF